MKQIIGYLVKDSSARDVIAATGNAAEAIEIAKEYPGLCYMVVTTIKPNEDPVTERFLLIKDY